MERSIDWYFGHSLKETLKTHMTRGFVSRDRIREDKREMKALSTSARWGSTY